MELVSLCMCAPGCSIVHFVKMVINFLLSKSFLNALILPTACVSFLHSPRPPWPDLREMKLLYISSKQKRNRIMAVLCQYFLKHQSSRETLFTCNRQAELQHTAILNLFVANYLYCGKKSSENNLNEFHLFCILRWIWIPFGCSRRPATHITMQKKRKRKMKKMKWRKKTHECTFSS